MHAARTAVGLGILCSVAWGQIPPGYEMVRITDEGYNSRPALNNNGQIVYMHADNGPDPTAQIMLYDRGVTIPITSDDSVQNAIPDINDAGAIVWSASIGPEGRYGRTHEIMLYQGGVTSRITNNDLYDGGPRINDSGQIVWQSDGTRCPNVAVYDIYFFDGATTRRLTDGQSNNQVPRLNNHGQIVWSRGERQCNGPLLSRAAVLYSDGEITQISPNDARNAGANDIDDQGRVYWQHDTMDPCHGSIFVWENGVSKQIINPGEGGVVNESGHVGFWHMHHTLEYFEAFIYRDGRIFQIPDNRDFWNFVYDINDRGEAALMVGEHGDCDIYYMRRLPLGDLNCDAEVNAFDIEPFIAALSDPAVVERAGCDPMLADINEDGAANAFDIQPFVELLTQ